MVIASLDVFYENNGRSAAKHLSNGERSETVRDGMGLVSHFFKYPQGLFNIQSDPCESRAVREEGGLRKCPSGEPRGSANDSSTWIYTQH